MADSNENGNSDEKLELFCDLCHLEGENIAAFSFCEVCYEYLCKHCNKVHSRSAGTRKHIVKEGDDLPEKYPSKESSIDTPEKCFVHGSEAISHFCISHEELCCSKCLSWRHQNCTDVVNADSCLSEGGIEEEENDLKGKMNGLTEDLNNIMFLIQQSHKAIKYNYDEANSTMLKAKAEIFEHIEGIYDALNKQLCETRDKDLDKILKFKEKCDTLTFDMKSTETYLKENKIRSKNHLALAMKKARIKVKSNQRDLKEINFKPHLKPTRYRFQPDSGKDFLKTEPSSFGSIEILENVIKAVYQLNCLNAHDQDDFDTCCITGIALLSETRLVLADNKNFSVKLVDTEQNTILAKVKLESAPWDVTVLPNKQVAVTMPDCKTVDFLSVSENKSMVKLQSKQIKLEGKCYGLTYAKEKVIVIVCVDNLPAKLEWYDLDGNLSLSVATDAKNPQYIASHADGIKIYMSDNARNMKITERSGVDAKLLDTLQKCIDEVTGIDVDKTGFLYYCDSYYHQVDCVYIDAKTGEERERYNLIAEIDPYPKCLAFCNATNRLFVGKDGNDIGVYIVI